MRADVPTNVPAERKGADFRFAQGFKPALPGSCVKAVCAPLRTRHEPKAKARVSFKGNQIITRLLPEVIDYE